MTYIAQLSKLQTLAVELNLYKMKLALSLLLLSLLGLSTASEYSRTVSYEGELVIRCGMQNERMRELLNHDMVDVWKVTTDSADIRLQYDLYEQLRDKFPECVVLHASVEKLVQEFEQNMQKRSNVTAEWFEEYHTYDEIVNWYQTLAKDSPIMKYITSIGKSVEGRDQPAVHIGAEMAEKKIYFQCQIHAREWISGATCMYIANYLVENYGKNEQITNLLKDLEFIFVPFVNPDGYEYTWANNRLWRKNRQKNPGSSCYGVDLNRNYNDHWGGAGSSSNPCSDTYHGTSAASEPETQNTANYFKSSGNIVGAIDWHSFSQLILRPYGWTKDPCPDEEQLKALGDKMSSDTQKVHGKKYTSQRAVDLYITTGSASDWFYSDDANTKNIYRAAGFTIELRDTGEYGFLLPPAQIIPTGEEMVPAVLAFAENLRDNPIPKK